MADRFDKFGVYWNVPTEVVLDGGNVPWARVLDPFEVSPLFAELDVTDVIAVYLAGRCYMPMHLIPRGLDIAPDARVRDLTLVQREQLNQLFARL